MYLLYLCFEKADSSNGFKIFSQQCLFMAQGDYEVFDNEFLVLKNESSRLYSWHDVALTGLVYFPNFADARTVY